MTVREALLKVSGSFEHSQSPWLDACILLAHASGITREKILASFPDEIDEKDWQKFQKLGAERAKGYPVAYLVGTKEFYGRDFHVEEGILCPRPETEFLVEDALNLIDSNDHKSVHDICTGSGCIGLTIALERPECRVSISDISPISQKVATMNRDALGATEVPFTLCSLLDGIEGKFDIIVTNPPYLTKDETDERMNDHWQEPALALDGGNDGLDLIRDIIQKAPDHLNKGGDILIEADPAQMTAMSDLLTKRGFHTIRIIKDLATLDRIICAKWGEKK